MAGMQALLFGYDNGALCLELEEFPSLTFYDNGVLMAKDSHNQSFGDLQPYTLYSYDAETDTYQEMASVYSWDRELSEQDYSGEKFPTEIDEDNNGTVYSISLAESEGEDWVDDAEYEKWCKSWLDGTKEIEIFEQELTLENIEAVTATY